MLCPKCGTNLSNVDNVFIDEYREIIGCENCMDMVPRESVEYEYDEYEAYEDDKLLKEVNKFLEEWK